VTESYSLYAWGNHLSESEADRLPAWLKPDVLSGDRVFVHPYVTMTDEDPLRVDAGRTVFALGGEDRYVRGHELADTGEAWRVAYVRVATDGTRTGAEKFVEELLELVEMDELSAGDGRRMPFGGEIVTSWEDLHGQWDMALVRD
jgi:hypothetical protein